MIRTVEVRGVLAEQRHTPGRARWIDGASLVGEGPDEPFAPAPAPRLSERARAAMRRRAFSPRTEEAYLGWMCRYHEFHGRRDPARLGAEHVTAFLMP